MDKGKRAFAYMPLYFEQKATTSIYRYLLFYWFIPLYFDSTLLYCWNFTKATVIIFWEISYAYHLLNTYWYKWNNTKKVRKSNNIIFSMVGTLFIGILGHKENTIRVTHNRSLKRSKCKGRHKCRHCRRTASRHCRQGTWEELSRPLVQCRLRPPGQCTPGAWLPRRPAGRKRRRSGDRSNN